eukprot:TRINITY_DN8534_c0_g1_i1.p1 TRINITY_DN8534_c0_g1~~TRINITY_DN8534_c0_g1_i1.p1  ORF type:complete len:755 (+),score=134.45 TRINITY_DN8534_c0_g1_i1:71-2335(+)
MRALLLCNTLLLAAATEWHDVRDLGVRGRGFDVSELESFADRLPAKAKGKVRDVIWELSTNSAGLYVDFLTDSPSLQLNRTYNSDSFEMWHFPSTGVAGLDLFEWDVGNATWRWAGVTRSQTKRNEVEQIGDPLKGMRKFRLHFPLYNGLEAMSIGIAEGHTITAAPYEYNSTGPILWYGTSIAQGGVVSRPGFSFMNHIRRNIKTEILNFGFSGSCLMEQNVTDFLVTVKPTPSIFIVDCEWNMDADMISQRAVPLVNQIRQALPTTSIILVEGTLSGPAWISAPAKDAQTAKWEALRTSYETLLKEGVKDLHYVTGPQLYTIQNDPNHFINPTVGGVHPTDLGQYAMTQYYTEYLPTILKNKTASGSQPAVFGGNSVSRKLPKTTITEPTLRSSTDASSLAFFDVEKLGVMNRPFNDTERYFNRLPASAKGQVRGIVYSLSQYNTGMAVHFITDATEIYLNFSLANNPKPLWHMPDSGVSGGDLYRFDDANGVYRSVGCLEHWADQSVMTTQLLATGLPGKSAKYALYLPLRNEFLSAAIGVPSGHVVTRDPDYDRDSVTAYGKKPIVWYGTSIDQGGVASRPGTTYTNILTRNLKRQVLNYGFAGNGIMETSVMQYLAEIDAALFVIDCLPNMGPTSITNNTQPLYHFIRTFNNSFHAETPILFVAGTDYGSFWSNPASNNNKRAALEAQINDIQKQKYDPNLHLFLNRNNELFAKDMFINPTVGGTHPSDLGHREIARYYTTYLPQFLKD